MERIRKQFIIGSERLHKNFMGWIVAYNGKYCQNRKCSYALSIDPEYIKKQVAGFEYPLNWKG